MLFDKRLIFVTGKGGTGKTTLSAAIGKAASKMGKRVLVVDTSEGGALGTLFSRGALLSEPVDLDSNIQGVRINPKKVLEEYIQKYISIGFIANRIIRAELFEHLAEATPGLREIMTLGQIWRWEKRKDEQDEYIYDMIVVDTPATGHGISLLKQPRTLVEMLRFGPIAGQTRAVQEMLQNKDKTALFLVTAPEELPVNEAVQFIRVAEEELNMEIGRIVVNGLYSELFSPEEIVMIDKIPENGPNPEKKAYDIIIDSAKTYISRKRTQNYHVDRLQQSIGQELLRIPYFFTNALSELEIDAISGLLRQREPS